MESISKRLNNSEVDILATFKEKMGTVVACSPETLEALLMAVLARGHILIEDQPGVGKTTLARALAKLTGLTTIRIQGTPDLHPSDLLGSMVWDKKLDSFRLHKGPIFTEILLADELNRATPRSQSALLQAMEERTVSIEGNLHTLSEFFTVIATQNQLEHSGTFQLPSSQLDRFTIRLHLGHADSQNEKKILQGSIGRNKLEDLESLLDHQQLRELRSAAENIPVPVKTIDFIQSVLEWSRSHHNGLSTRAGLSWLAMSKACALLYKHPEVWIDHTLKVAECSLSHRFKDQTAAFQVHINALKQRYGAL